MSSDESAVKERMGFLGRFSSNPSVVTLSYATQMQASHDSPHERLRRLLRLSRPKPDCRSYDNLPAIRDYYEAIASEARAIAASADDAEFADVLTARAATPVGPGAEVNIGDPPRMKTTIIR